LGRLIVALLQVPLLFGIAIDLGAIEATKGFNLWLYGLGVLCFGLPVAAIGSLLLLPRWLKISALILMPGPDHSLLTKGNFS
jgi:hypothetical protein